MTADQDRPKRKPGRPPLPDSERKGGANLTFRARAGLRERLAAEAAKSGRSMSEEIEFRLNRDLHWGQEAARIQAIRQAGLQIVRDVGGGVTVNVNPEMLLAEADGILRSGFIGAEDVDKSPTEIMVKRAVAEALKEAGLARPKSEED